MLVDLDNPKFAVALDRAGEELGLPDYYRSSVRPLFRMPATQWPMCCGGSCEPCAQTLVAVAERVCVLIGVNRERLP